MCVLSKVFWVARVPSEESRERETRAKPRKRRNKLSKKKRKEKDTKDTFPISDTTPPRASAAPEELDFAAAAKACVHSIFFIFLSMHFAERNSRRTEGTTLQRVFFCVGQELQSVSFFHFSCFLRLVTLKVSCFPRARRVCAEAVVAARRGQTEARLAQQTAHESCFSESRVRQLVFEKRIRL